MKNIAITVSYDGTDFSGWQRQNGARTVQGTIEAALQKIHKHPVALFGSGRTDAGVHARAQVANFFSDIESMDAQNYMRALNGMLPQDVRVSSASQKDDSFNARFSATSRTYRYFLHCGRPPLATETRYVWHLGFSPSIQSMNEMAAHLRGELDCASFAAAGDKSKSTFRFIEGAKFFQDGEKIVFEITANAYLWKMIRTIVGTIVGIARRGGGSDEFKQILLSKRREDAGTTAPPNGLFLWDVSFDGIRRHV